MNGKTPQATGPQKPVVSKIKEEHSSKFIAFNGGGNTLLGDRTDLNELAIIAHESGDKSLLDLFEDLPSLEDLKKEKTDRELAANAARQ